MNSRLNPIDLVVVLQKAIRQKNWAPRVPPFNVVIRQGHRTELTQIDRVAYTYNFLFSDAYTSLSSLIVPFSR